MFTSSPYWMMKRIVPEYKSNNSVYEELDLPPMASPEKRIAEMS